MRRYLSKFVNENNALTDGVIALAIIGLIVFGCTCNTNDGFRSTKDDNTATKPAKNSEEDTPKKVNETYSKDKVPSDAANQEIVKTTLMNFSDAVQRADFSDFHKTVAKSWRKRSLPSDFEKGFKEFIDKKINISQIRSKDAKFVPPPYIDDKYRQKVLFLKGRYETSPRSVNFDLEYIFEDSEWRLIKIEVNTG